MSELQALPNRGTALIADDDPVMRSLLSAYMSASGFVCTVAEDGDSASEHITNTPFNMILLDLNMPGLLGYEVASRARSSNVNQKTPIAIITSEDELGTLAKSFAAGASAFLQKPVTRKSFTSLLKAFGYAASSSNSQ
jgi:CheY-like chemotaxis protein